MYMKNKYVVMVECVVGIGDGQAMHRLQLVGEMDELELINSQYEQYEIAKLDAEKLSKYLLQLLANQKQSGFTTRLNMVLREMIELAAACNCDAIVSKCQGVSWEYLLKVITEGEVTQIIRSDKLITIVVQPPKCPSTPWRIVFKITRAGEITLLCVGGGPGLEQIKQDMTIMQVPCSFPVQLGLSENAATESIQFEQTFQDFLRDTFK
jgi:hypothetical protein